MSAPRDVAAALRAFLDLRHADEDAGVTRTLAEYQAGFPGFEDEIAWAFGELGPGTSSAATAAAAVERRAGPYRLLERRGRGGQGEVFLAHDTRLDRRVAVKVLDASLALVDAAARDRFRREAEVAARLEHPGICSVLDMDLDDSPPWIAMPWIDGQPLAALVERGAPATAEAVRDRVALFARLARALAAGHAAGVVHRDVKPGNVIVRPGGEPVLLDFGLARDERSEGASLTRSGDWLGTLPYMAPEQIRGDRAAVGAATDVWGLGVSLFEGVCGRRPFRAASRELLARAILSSEPAAARAANPAVPRDLSVVVSRALEKDPSRRYAHAGEFADELDRVLEGRPVEARPVSRWTRGARWARRNPSVAASLAAVILVLAAALAITLALLSSRTRALADREEALGRITEEERLRRVFLDELMVDRLPEIADELWPATPAMVGASRGMDWWLDEARGVLARVPGYESWLAALVASGGPRRPHDDPRRGGRGGRIRDEIDSARATLSYIEASGTMSGWRDPLEKLVAELESRLERLGTTRFTDASKDRLELALRSVVEAAPGLRGAVEEIASRRDAALSLEARTVTAHAGEWRAAAAGVAADPRFAGFVLEPVIGLVPLGADPSSGLQEFAHVFSGATPERGEDGALVVTEESAIVLVLVPGGETTLGAVRPDAEHPEGSAHVDPRAHDAEGPLQRVRLDPYLIGKYEVTQGQWLRLTGKNPAYNQGKRNLDVAIDLRHPVEQVAWIDARPVFVRHGLVIPTEAQWEHAARAGTTTPWWTGADERSVAGAGNVADRTALARFDTHGWECDDWLDDGHYLHAPVGSYRANAFGLHDVIGNVYEWCRDIWGYYGRVPLRPGDGLRLWWASNGRTVRGSAFCTKTVFHRVSLRSKFTPDFRNPYVGVRAAMELVPVRR